MVGANDRPATVSGLNVPELDLKPVKTVNSVTGILAQ